MEFVAPKVLAIWAAVSLAAGLAWIAVVLAADTSSALRRLSRSALRRSSSSIDDVRPVTR